MLITSVWTKPWRTSADSSALGASVYFTMPDTARGSVAKDGTGRNGTYTQYLLRFMTEPNLPVTEMFIKVRVAVQQETNGAQIPWEQSSLLGSFSFQLVAAGLPSGTQVTVETSLSQTLPVTTNPVPSVGTSRPSTEITPGSVPPSPSGGTQVAVGVYPQPPAALQTL